MSCFLLYIVFVHGTESVMYLYVISGYILRCLELPFTYKKDMLSQGEPYDAAVNFDTYRILQQHRAVSLPQHGFFVPA